MEIPDDLHLGKIFIREGKPGEALKRLHQAVLKHLGEQGTSRPQDPKSLDRVPAELLSYYGLCVALVENRVQHGLTLCKMAIEKEMLRPEFYLNLGKVYIKANQKVKALNTFRKGLQLTEKNSELLRELEQYGIRRRPAIRSLSRNNFLNRYLGLLLSRFEDRSNQAE